MKMPPTLLCLSALLAVTAWAQNPPPPPPPVNHDFDFWVGDWEVTNRANGKKAGKNRIERQHGGRVLVENYTTPGPYTGMSLNAYDGLAKRWHQCWMDNAGGVLDLYGGLVDGAMVLTGETVRPGGAKQMERITWTPNSDGTVRQHWEQSADGGKTWKTAFDGLYRRK
jgi:hypothetical protein